MYCCFSFCINTKLISLCEVYHTQTPESGTISFPEEIPTTKVGAL